MKSDITRSNRQYLTIALILMTSIIGAIIGAVCIVISR